MALGRLIRFAKRPEGAAATIGAVGTVLFTALVASGPLTGDEYVGAMTLLAFVCLAFLVLRRIKEFNLSDMTITLRKYERVRDELETVKTEVEEMYGGIERLRKAPLVLDAAKMRELGIEKSAIPTSGALMRYTSGCMKRERERLARVFVTPKCSEKLAEAVLDGSMDDSVFQWRGPEQTLGPGSSPGAADEADSGKG